MNTQSKQLKQGALVALASAVALPASFLAATKALAAEPALAPFPTSLGAGNVQLAADTANLSDAERLKAGQEQYRSGQYDESVTTLQMVKRDALSDAEKKTLDDSLSQASSAAKERASARAEFEKGQDAFNAKDYNAALTHFQAAKQNKFADAATMDKADTQIQATQKLASASGADGGSDAKALYRKGRDEYRSGDWASARKDLTAARDGGYKAGFLEQSPEELLAKIDAKDKGTAAPAEATAAAPAPAAAATAEQPAAPAAEGMTAKQAYLKGREEYRKGDWIAARRDLGQAESMGYKTGLFEDAPSKYLARMDRKEQADAQKAQLAQAQQSPNAASDVTPPAPAPSEAPAAPGAKTDAAQNAPTPAPTGTANPQANLEATANNDAARRANNLGAAADKVTQAEQLRRDGRTQEALDAYSAALTLDPNNAAAQQGRNELRAQMGLDNAGGGNLAQQVAGDIQIRRDRVNQLVTQYLGTARADIQSGNFTDARKQIDLARTAVAADNSVFNNDELAAFAARIDSTDKERDAAESRFAAAGTKKAQEDAEARNHEVRLVAERQKESTIHDLIVNAQALIRDGKYEQAMGIIDQILTLDATNDYARGVRPLLQEKAILQVNRENRELFDLHMERSLNAAEEKKIPYDDILRYPPNWPDISELRDASVRSERGVKEVDTAVQAQLERKLPEINFNGNAFSDVVDFLRDVTGANIFVNWRALETAGITKEAPVTARLKEVKFSKALNTILADVGGGTVKLSYTIDDGVITISTADDLAKNTLTHSYDIRDLLVDVPDFTDAPDLSLLMQQTGQGGQGGGQGGAGGGGGGAGGGGAGGGQQLFGNNQGQNEEKTLTRQERVDAIVKLIEETVDPNSWRDNGGQVGAVKELSGQLIVTQTNDNQRQLVNLLEQLRETRAIQITIETRFIQVERHYLEDVGLNLDFFFNTNNPNHFSPISVTQSSADFTQNPQTNIPGTLGTPGSAPQSLIVQGTYLDNFQVNLLLRATEATSRAASTTAPRVTLFNGQRAYVLVATQQAYVSNLTPVIGNGVGAFAPTISPLTTGVKLDVQATVSSDRKYVTMTLRPQLASLLALVPFTFQTAASTTVIGGTTGTGTISGGGSIGSGIIQEPEIQLTEVKTTVSVPDGGTLLLGGETLSGEITKEAGVPVLSKIPVLKRLFTNRSQAKDDVVVLILVRPTIIIQREAEQKQFPLLSTKSAVE